jgi:hypothetical protein
MRNVSQALRALISDHASHSRINRHLARNGTVKLLLLEQELAGLVECRPLRGMIAQPLSHRDLGPGGERLQLEHCGGVLVGMAAENVGDLIMDGRIIDPTFIVAPHNASVSRGR